MRLSIKLLTFGLMAGAYTYYGGDWAIAAPVGAPAETAKAEVGISSHDGISLSGTDVLVTRNGVSEKLTKEMSLASGLKVRPNGMMVKADGTEVMLRPEQVLTFDGKLMSLPVVPPTKTPTTGQ